MQLQPALICYPQITSYALQPTFGSDFSSWSWASYYRVASSIHCTSCTPPACTAHALELVVRPRFLTANPYCLSTPGFVFHVFYLQGSVCDDYGRGPIQVYSSFYARFSIAPLPSLPTSDPAALTHYLPPLLAVTRCSVTWTSPTTSCRFFGG